MDKHTRRRHLQHGFSLLEMLTVVAILTLVLGAVFQQIITAQKRYRAEEAKLDISQESREFLDQMVRDLHQAGYPGPRLYDTGAAPSAGPSLALAAPIGGNPLNSPDVRVAAGLVKYTYNDLWFEGDVDGDGRVEVVEYKLDPSNVICPCSIQRRQTVKIDGTGPLGQTQSTFSTELQNVINTGGSGGAKTNGSLGITGTGPGGVSNEVLYGALEGAYIFQAFDGNGNAVAPVDIGNDPTKLLTSIRSIQITINVLAKQSASDLQTGRRSAVSMTASARISNQ